MRDMNQELLNNPFDQELQSITKPFGVLLRSIVATIDKHGLKQRRLAWHLGEVEEFFRMLIAQSSDAASALRERLLKCRDKLFTFLRYDSVPWNNNKRGKRDQAVRLLSGGNDRNNERGRAERIPRAAQHLPDVSVQGDQLSEVPAI
jgi:hypothetical protein